MTNLYAVHEDGHRIPLDAYGSYTPDASGKWTITRFCDHRWIARGTEGDQWQECFLCGEQVDVKGNAPESLARGGVLGSVSLWSHGDGPEVLVPLPLELGRSIAEGLQERIDAAAARVLRPARLIHADNCPILAEKLPCTCLGGGAE